MTERKDHLDELREELTRTSSLGRSRRVITTPDILRDEARRYLELIADTFHMPIFASDLNLLELLINAAMGTESSAALDVTEHAKDAVTFAVVQELRDRMKLLMDKRMDHMPFPDFDGTHVSEVDRAVALTSYGSARMLQAAHFIRPEGPAMAQILQEKAQVALSNAGDLFPSDQLLGVASRIHHCVGTLELTRAMMLGGVNKTMEVYERRLGRAA